MSKDEIIKNEVSIKTDTKVYEIIPVRIPKDVKDNTVFFYMDICQRLTGFITRCNIQTYLLLCYFSPNEKVLSRRKSLKINRPEYDNKILYLEKGYCSQVHPGPGNSICWVSIY